MKSLEEIERDLDPTTRVVFNCLFWVGVTLDLLFAGILIIVLVAKIL
jgi:hypothetical protein